MRTLIVYLLALGAVAAALRFGFPELFGLEPAREADAGENPDAKPPVVVAPAVREPFAEAFEALGTVHANESVEITPKAADHVRAIHFEDGQDVEKGQLLAVLHAEEEKAQLAEAVALRDERKAVYERILELHESQIRSAQDLDAERALLEAADARVQRLQATLADHQVVAPFSGTLGLRRISVGAWVQPATVITTLDDLSVVKLDFTIPEPWLSHVRPGMKISATSGAWPGTGFEGTVTTVGTRLDERTRSATVRALLPNPERRLRPGMLLRVRVDRGEDPVLQVPEEALIPVGDQQFVLRVGADSIAERVEVTVGRRRVGAVEILSGLSAGDRVVVEGVVRVRPGGPVAVVAERTKDA